MKRKTTATRPITKRALLRMATPLLLFAAGVLILEGDLLAHGDDDHGAAAPAPTRAADGGRGGIMVAKEQQFALGMITEPAAPRDLLRSAGVTGHVIPRTEAIADVVSPLTGRIVGGALPRLGDQVGRGQVLFRVAQVLAPSERATLRSEQIRAKAELDAAEREVKRLERLEGVVAGKQLVEATIRRDAARAAYGNITSQLSERASTVAVTAPIGGTIIKAEIAGGETIDGSRVVYQIADLSKVWVEADLFEGDIARVQGGKVAEITTPSYPGETFRGSLHRLGSAVDPETRTIPALFVVDNPAQRLKLNMSASVAVALGEGTKVLAIPESAVVRSGARTIVFVHTTPESFEPRDVALGAGKGGGYIEVKSGINPGDRVLTSGAHQLKAMMGM